MAKLELELDADIAHYRASTFADSTKKAYSSHRRSYIKFCLDMGYQPIPVSTHNLCRYTVFLAKRLQVSSIKKYLNIVRILHLEHGFPNPLAENWFVNSLIQGISREKGLTVNRKLPITPNMLLKIREFYCIRRFYVLGNLYGGILQIFSEIKLNSPQCKSF